MTSSTTGTGTGLNEAVARPIRTLMQAGPAYALVEFWDAFFTHLNAQQYAAAVVVITMALSAIQTAIENGLGKGILRSVPPKTVPVVDSTPTNGGTA